MITVVSSDNCPYCDSVKTLLKSLNIKYKEINITNNQDELMKIVSISGMMTVPQVFNGDILKENLLGGFSEIKDLNDKGKLLDIIK